MGASTNTNIHLYKEDGESCPQIRLKFDTKTIKSDYDGLVMNYGTVSIELITEQSTYTTAIYVEREDVAQVMQGLKDTDWTVTDTNLVKE